MLSLHWTKVCGMTASYGATSSALPNNISYNTRYHILYNLSIDGVYATCFTNNEGEPSQNKLESAGTLLQPCDFPKKILISYADIALFSEGSKCVHDGVPSQFGINGICSSHSSPSFSLEPKDMNFLVTTEQSGTLRIWDFNIHSFRLTPRTAWIGPESFVNCICIDPRNSQIAVSCSEIKKVWVYEVVESGRVTTSVTFKISAPCSVLKFGCNDDLLVGQNDGKISIFDLFRKEQICYCDDHSSSITSICNIPSISGLRGMMTTAKDQVINIWDLSSCRSSVVSPCQQIQCDETLYSVVCVPLKELSKDKDESSMRWFCLTGGEKGILKAWNPINREFIASSEKNVEPNSKKPMQRMIQLNAENVLCIDNEVAMTIWNICANFSVSRRVEFYSCNLFPAATDVYGVKFIPPAVTKNENTKNSVCSCVFLLGDSIIRFARVDRLFCMYHLEGHSDTVLCISTTPIGAFVVSGAKDRTVRLWNLNLKKCLCVFYGHLGPVVGVALNQKTRHLSKDKEGMEKITLMILSVSEDRCFKIWRCCVYTENIAPENIQSINRSECSLIIHKNNVVGLCINPTDTLAATCSFDKTIQVWNLNVSNSKELILKGTLSGHLKTVWNISFSPIERVLASCSNDGTVKLWNLDNFNCLKTFSSLTNASILDVAVLPNGIQVMGCCDDGSVRLWNIRTSNQADVLDTGTEKVWSLDISNSNNETFLLLGARSGQIQLWKDNTEEIILKKKMDHATKQMNDFAIDQLAAQNDISQVLQLCIANEKCDQLYKILIKHFRGCLLNKDTQQPLAVESDVSFNGGQALAAAMSRLSTSDLSSLLLRFVPRWIANAKTAWLATYILNLILQLFSSTKFTEIQGLESAIDIVHSYNIKHEGKVDNLIEKVHLLDLILGGNDPNQKTFLGECLIQSKQPTFDSEGTVDFTYECLFAE